MAASILEDMSRSVALLQGLPDQQNRVDSITTFKKELEEQLENANSIVDELVKGVEEALWERLLTNTLLHWDLLEGGLQISLHLSYPHYDDAVHVGTRSRLDV